MQDPCRQTGAPEIASNYETVSTDHQDAKIELLLLSGARLPLQSTLIDARVLMLFFWKRSAALNAQPRLLLQLPLAPLLSRELVLAMVRPALSCITH
jgi:hypothetical protein